MSLPCLGIDVGKQKLYAAPAAGPHQETETQNRQE